MKSLLAVIAGLALAGCAATGPTQGGGVVKITSLGSHDGEMGSFLSTKVKSLGGDPAKLVRLVRFGAQTMVGKVMVAGVPAVHSNGLPPAFLPPEQAKALDAAGLTAYVGEPGGFVLRFSNGLTAYLSGDTGITAEQDLVVRGHYKAATHVNEPATVGGKLVETSKTAAFVRAAKMPVHVPLSGKTMEFDGNGRRTAGC